MRCQSVRSVRTVAFVAFTVPGMQPDCPATYFVVVAPRLHMLLVKFLRLMG